MVFLTECYSKPRYFVISCLPLALWTHQAYANEPPLTLDIELRTEVPTLIASPELCEFQKGDTDCQMKASLLWETPRSGDYCLWDKEQKEPLECWANSWSGSYSLDFSSDHDRIYWLTRGLKGTVAAQVVISITWPLEQRLKAKRRRGFWRVF